MHDGKERGPQGVETESSYSKMKRLIFLELRKPGKNIPSVAKEFGFEHALITEKKPRGAAALKIDYDALPILEMLEKLEAANAQTNTEFVGDTTPPLIENFDDGNASSYIEASLPETTKIPEKNESGLILPDHIEVSPDKFLTSDQTISPRSHDPAPRSAIDREKRFESKNRSRLLVEILSELNLPYEVKLGDDSKITISSESRTKKWRENFGSDISDYQTFILPTLRKIILINNTGENATYIVHDLEEKCADWKNYSANKRSLVKSLGRDKMTWVKHDSKKDPNAIFWKKEVAHALTADEFERMRDNGKERKNVQDAIYNLVDAYKKWRSQKPETRGAFSHAWLNQNGFSGLYRWTRRTENETLERLVELIDTVDIVEDIKIGIKRDFVTIENNFIDSEEEAATRFLNIFYQWQSDTDPNKDKFNIEYLRKNKQGAIYDWCIRNNFTLHSLAQKTGVSSLINEISKIQTRTKFTRNK